MLASLAGNSARQRRFQRPGEASASRIFEFLLKSAAPPDPAWRVGGRSAAEIDHYQPAVLNPKKTGGDHVSQS